MAKLLLLSALIMGSFGFTIPTERNPNFVPDGRAEYAKALSKWGVDLPHGLAKYVSTKAQNTDVSAISQDSDREYLSPISVGTPPQTLLMDIDTGSSDFWVFSSETAAGDLRNHTHYYTPGSSNTAARVPNATWSITYGDMSYAYGRVWTDTITVGNISIPNAVVETAVDVSVQMASDWAMSGIFGTAFGLPSRVEPRSQTVLQSLSPQLDQKVFTADLKWHADGEYEFGTIDKTKYKGSIHWAQLIDNATYWKFLFRGYSVQGDELWYGHEWPAIADTGTTMLMLEEDVVKKYYAQVPTAQYDASYGVWTYPCETNLPDFHLSIDEPQDGVWTVTVPGKYINYTEFDFGNGNGSSSTCMGGLQGNNDEEFSILGDVFLKAVFAVFDITGARVGFAEKELS